MHKRVVIVGASRGIGKALAEHFANEGHEVFVLSRKPIQTDLPIYYHPFDLEKNVSQQAKELFTQIGGSFDILINNAGLLVNKAFPELTHEDISRCYQVNVIGVMETVQSILPYLNDKAHIVNISSMGGFQGSMKFAGLSAYSTSKAAICSFTELFAEEYKESSLSMNCLCLGAVQTEMLEEAFPGYTAPIQPREMATYISDFALNGHKYFKGKILPVSLSTP